MALTEKEFATKAAKLELTLGEAIDFAMARPKLTPTQESNIKALGSSLGVGNDLSPDTPFHEMQDEVNWSQLDNSVNKSGTNYYYNFQNLETVLHKKMRELGVKNVMKPGPAEGVQIEAYPTVAGQNSISGGTQRTGNVGEQPMRGLLSSEDIYTVYSEAIPEVEAKYGKAVSDALTYHLITFHRPTQIVGNTAIKLSDITILDDQIIVKGAKAGHKTRPQHTLPRDSSVGQLIERNYRREYEQVLLGEGKKGKVIDPSSQNLFPISKNLFDKAFRESVSPRLKPFEDVLPMNNRTGNPITTPSAVRSFMPRMLREEKKYPKDLIKAMQGHIASDIIDRNYMGQNLPPEEGIGLLMNDIAEKRGRIDKFETGAIGSQQMGLTGPGAVPLSEEQQAKIAEATAAEAEVRTVEAQSQVLEKQKDLVTKRQETVAFWKSEEGQKLLQEEAELEEQKRQIKQAEKAKTAPAEEPEFKKFEFSDEEADDLAKGFNEAFGVEEEVVDMDDPDAPKKGKLSVGKAALGTLPLVGLPISAMAKEQEYEELVEEGVPAPVAGAYKTGEFILEEFTPYGVLPMAQQMGELVGDVQPGEQEDPYSFTDADVMLIEEAKEAREKSDVESFGRFMEEDLIQP